MGLREIVLASALLLSTVAFSQNKLNFDVYTKRDGLPKFNSGSVKASSGEIDCSFLFGIYSMKFNRVNDSMYRETVKTSFFWIQKEEIFDYLLKDSSYLFKKYSVLGEEPREEKVVLEGTVYNKKYKDLPRLFEDFKKGLIGDSVHMIVQGVPYSAKIENTKKGDEIVYFSNPPEIKDEPGDVMVFSYPFQIHAKEKSGEIIPFLFYTKIENAKTKKATTIEGVLREK
jgi:hypothetical protein